MKSKIPSQTVRNEGLRALFKGWVPAYLRLGPHFIIVTISFLPPIEIPKEGKKRKEKKRKERKET